MSEINLNCASYGTFSAAKTICKSCPGLDYCKDATAATFAADPIIDFDDERAPLDEISNEQRLDITEHDLTPKLRELMAELLRVSGAHPTRLVIIIARISGMSYSEIGDLFGVAKQAIHKHVKYIGAGNPELGRLMRMRLMESEHARAAMERTQLFSEFNALRRASKTTLKNFKKNKNQH